MLYTYLVKIVYISFGVGYCLLLVLGSPELLETRVPQLSNSNSSHASFILPLLSGNWKALIYQDEDLFTGYSQQIQ